MKGWFENIFDVKPSTYSSWTNPQKVFYCFIIYGYLNIGTIFTKIFQQSIPVNIVLFALVSIYIVLRIRYKFYPKYFVAVWLFYVIYLIFGFMGSRPEFSSEVIQAIVKYWIALIALPWLGLQLIRKEDLYVYLKTFMVLGALGAVFCLIQLLFFDAFRWMVDSSQPRAGGFWINPNLCGYMLMVTFFLTFFFKGEKSPWIGIMRVLLIIGVLSTGSRTSMGLMVLGSFYYAYISKNVKLVFHIFIGLGCSILLFIIVIPFMGEYQVIRLMSMLQLASGEEMQADTRSVEWLLAFEAVYTNSPFWGLGHGTMNNIVPLGANGLGPHNLYIWMWGNSGIIGLSALVVFLFYLFLIARINQLVIRASTIIYSLILFAYNFMAHDLMAHQTFSTTLMIFLLFIYHCHKPHSSINKL